MFGRILMSGRGCLNCKMKTSQLQIDVKRTQDRKKCLDGEKRKLNLHQEDGEKIGMKRRKEEDWKEEEEGTAGVSLSDSFHNEKNWTSSRDDYFFHIF